MTQALNQILDQVCQLLKECGWESKAEWFSDRREVLNDSLRGSAEFRKALEELKAATGGMGGFTDIPLTPNSNRMTVQQARTKQWELAEALGDAIENMKRH